MNERKLSHDEIDLAIKHAEEIGCFADSWVCYELVAEAAQRKLVEWLIKQDEGESHKLGKWSRIIYVNEEQWQELRKGVGLE